MRAEKIITTKYNQVIQSHSFIKLEFVNTYYHKDIYLKFSLFTMAVNKKHPRNGASQRIFIVFVYYSFRMAQNPKGKRIPQNRVSPQKSSIQYRLLVKSPEIYPSTQRVKWTKNNRHTLSYVPVMLGAGRRTRTPDLLITNQLLYRLSYTSILSFCCVPDAPPQNASGTQLKKGEKNER